MTKIIFILLLGFFCLEANANTAMVVETDRQVQSCHDNYFTGGARTTDNYDACGVAREIASSWAMLNCYFAGHSYCQEVSSYIVYHSGNTCEVRAAAEPDFNGYCREHRSFYRSAWARNYGSVRENCRMAGQVAMDAAYSNCRSNFNKCTIKQTAIVRYDSTFCEVGAVAQGR